MLKVSGLETHYATSQALFGMSFDVKSGEVVTLMGRNGMGKTTTVNSIIGIVPPSSGSIEFDGHEVSRLASFKTANLGIGLVPEGRQIFPNLSVRENLVATASNHQKFAEPWTIEKVYAMFPELERRATSMGNLLSGGEQQMLAIGRALMAQPKYLLLDEPSLGLAPLVVQQIRDLVVAINAQGTSVLLVEQNAAMALAIADHGYVMETGRVVMDKPAAALREDEDIREFYLGLRGEDASSFRDVKHYRRRKRWLS